MSTPLKPDVEVVDVPMEDISPLNQSRSLPAKKITREKKDHVTAPSHDHVQRHVTQQEHVTAVDWNEFTKNTTFHGVKYIFDESPGILRRALWVLVVLAAIVFFVSEVGLRTKEYFRYKTNVDMELHFEERVPFPAVTICNQNSHRMTKAVELGLYYFLEEAYSATNITDVAGEKYNLSMSYDELMDVTSHQLHDLIDKCLWRGHECDIPKDFSTTYTDLGVCYTFNGDPEAVKHVEDTAHVLSLVLNVEQYEHMRGPQNDAGLKMLLHSQDEVPLMKERGFAVAPGTHTLASITMTRKLSIEPPWGQCNMTAPPIPDCKLAHRSRIMAQQCGCRQMYMHGYSESDVKEPPCSIYDSFYCIQQLDTRQRQLQPEACSLPCNVTEYTPSLSYAQLSRINIDKLVLSDTQRYQQAQDNYLQALETLQRTNLAIKAKDQKTITGIADLADQLHQILNSSLLALDEGGELVQGISTARNWARDDQKNIQRLGDELEEKTTMGRDFLHDVVLECFLKDLKEMFKNYDELNFQFDFMRNCTQYDDPIFHDLPMFQVNTNLTEEQVREKCEKKKFKNEIEDAGLENAYSCQEAIEYTLYWFHGTVIYIEPSIQYLLNLRSVYEATVQEVFKDTTLNIADLEQHGVCIAALEHFNTNYLAALSDLALAMMEILQADNASALEDSLTTLQDILVTNDLFSFVTHVGDLEDACWWLQSFCRHRNKLVCYDEVETAFRATAATVASLSRDIQDTAAVLENLELLLDEGIRPKIEIAERYLAGDVTKLTLAEALTELDLGKALDDLLTTGFDLKTRVVAYSDRAGAMQEQWKGCYTSLLKGLPPVANTENLKSFGILQYANASSDRELRELWASLSVDKQGKVDAIITRFTDHILEQPVLDILGQIEPLAPDIAKAMAGVQAEAAAYLLRNHMSEEFFMQNFLTVDIFYKDLTYEEVTQDKAFALGSLIGEVGGFLGLLLGASILTVFELLDYLAISCLKKCRGGRRAEPMLGEAKDGKGVKELMGPQKAWQY